MAGYHFLFNLNELKCERICTGPGPDMISFRALLQDTSVQDKIQTIADVMKGPFRMATNPAPAKVGPPPVPATVVTETVNKLIDVDWPKIPDSILLTVTLIKGDAEVTAVRIPLTINLPFASITIDLGAPIAKIGEAIANAIQNDTIGKTSYPFSGVSLNQLLPPNGKHFEYTFDGNGSSYPAKFSLTAAPIP